MRRVTAGLRVFGLFLLITAGVLGLLILLLAILMPNSVTGLRIGSDVLSSTVRNQTGTLVESAKLNPLVDLLILTGAYVFVCLISWMQDQVSSYLANRKHFS